MKRIAYSKAAVKALAKMPANMAHLIRTKTEAYAADPASQANNVKALKGQDEIRLRVGDWRVIMNDRGEIIEISKIAPLGSVY
ncbi:type II toxin-antitoxin system RelE family toxin [Pseudaestuariivita rosea]|uniref:type II toxin-antitoxin system RelE family toxin n=1 Tax=Pseudaestuariivita rosea TaxID=2763263 RepID=UPI001ABA8B97